MLCACGCGSAHRAHRPTDLGRRFGDSVLDGLKTQLRESPSTPLRNFLLSSEQERRFWEGRETELQSFMPRPYLTGRGFLSLGGAEDSTVAIGQWRGLCREENLPEREVTESGLRELRQRLRRHGLRALIELGSARVGECELSPGDPLASPTAKMNELAQVMTGGLRERVIQYANQKCGERIRVEPPAMPQATLLADEAEAFAQRLKAGEIRATEARAQLRAHR